MRTPFRFPLGNALRLFSESPAKAVAHDYRLVYRPPPLPPATFRTLLVQRSLGNKAFYVSAIGLVDPPPCKSGIVGIEEDTHRITTIPHSTGWAVHLNYGLRAHAAPEISLCGHDNNHILGPAVGVILKALYKYYTYHPTVNERGRHPNHSSHVKMNSLPPAQQLRSMYARPASGIRV